MSDGKTRVRPPALTLQLGGFTRTGAAAWVALLVIVVLIVGLVVLLKPAFRWSPLWLSATLWIVFIAYWSAAAKTASPVKSAESPCSRQLHQSLLNLALLLLFLRIPGLKP